MRCGNRISNEWLSPPTDDDDDGLAGRQLNSNLMNYFMNNPYPINDRNYYCMELSPRCLRPSTTTLTAMLSINIVYGFCSMAHSNNQTNVWLSIHIHRIRPVSNRKSEIIWIFGQLITVKLAPCASGLWRHVEATTASETEKIEQKELESGWAMYFIHGSKCTWTAQSRSLTDWRMNK